MLSMRTAQLMCNRAAHVATAQQGESGTVMADTGAQ